MFNELQEMLRQRLGMGAQPNTYGGASSAAQRDFPGQTNYGVPEDNMIDTPDGYISREQYDQLDPVRQFGISANPQMRQSIQRVPGQRMVNPQFQQSRGSEGTAIQGRQYDPRLNPQGARQPRLQNAVNPQNLRLQ